MSKSLNYSCKQYMPELANSPCIVCILSKCCATLCLNMVLTHWHHMMRLFCILCTNSNWMRHFIVVCFIFRFFRNILFCVCLQYLGHSFMSPTSLAASLLVLLVWVVWHFSRSSSRAFLIVGPQMWNGMMWHLPSSYPLFVSDSGLPEILLLTIFWTGFHLTCL